MQELHLDREKAEKEFGKVDFNVYNVWTTKF